jgi:hypothetical protein
MAALGVEKQSGEMMPEDKAGGESPSDQSAGESISIVQRGNLKTIEATLRKQWRLGQNIVLCWSATENGILLIMVPHYFLGNYSAEDSNESAEERSEDANSNEGFVRVLLSGCRRKAREEFFEITNRLGVSATFIKLPTPLADDPPVNLAIEEIVRRYGLSYVDSRAVLLFDIAEFSLYTPFEQASQLNSLSYSMNSAYNKLLGCGIEINFARTTTGDGYYVWNRDIGHDANADLLHFLLLVIADNAMAREASRGNTVPLIRSAFHIGSHYELYQAEGVNPTVFSYIVGDVTIELARMVDLARPGQVYIGDFEVEVPVSDADETEAMELLDTLGFLARCNTNIDRLLDIRLGGHALEKVHCQVSGSGTDPGSARPRRFLLTDKHGLSRGAYNLELNITTDGRDWTLGFDPAQLPGGDEVAAGDDSAGVCSVSSGSVE